MDEVAERIREKHAAKQEKQRARYEEEKENGKDYVKSIIVERLPTGLYTLSFEGGGQLPRELQGKFTSIDKLRKLVVTRYGRDILSWQ